ncbi:MAG: hypothetical protein IPM53_08185 [Anaerolineaceae bacterium]|nr:hypothetical protein [Anaerolineaceae bacterium]
MKNKWLLVWSVFLLLLLAGLTGCSVETAHAPETQIEPTRTAVPTATNAPNTAVVFKRSGGLAGLNEQWTIFTNGRVETNTTITPQLSAEQVSQLLSSLESAGFFALDNTYLPDDTCCDRYLYEITAVQDTTFHRVTTLENTPDMPEALQQTLRLIQNLLFENSNE